MWFGELFQKDGMLKMKGEQYGYRSAMRTNDIAGHFDKSFPNEAGAVVPPSYRFKIAYYKSTI